MKNNKKNQEKLIDDYDYLSNAASSTDYTGLIPSREFDSCIIKIVRAGRIKPVLFLSSFLLYYLVIFSDM